jgi:hypothetical protein
MNELLKVTIASILLFFSFSIWGVAVVGGAIAGLLYSEWWHAISILVGFTTSFFLVLSAYRFMFRYEPLPYIKSKLLILYNKIRG